MTKWPNNGSSVSLSAILTSIYYTDRLFLASIVLAVLVVGCSRNSSPERAPSSQLAPPPCSSCVAPAVPPRKSTSMTLENGLGFYPLNSDGVPPGVQADASSVFTVAVITDEHKSEIKEFDITGGKAEKLTKEILVGPTNDLYNEVQDVVLTKEIDYCKTFKVANQKQCPLNTNIAMGTAFLALNGHTLWTNAHVVVGNMKFIKDFGGTSIQDQIAHHQRLGVFVFNKQHRLIVNPFVDKVQLLTAPAPTLAAEVEHKFYAQDSDYVALSIPQDIGVPIKISNKKITPGDEVYVLGYPACTGCTSSSYETSEPEDFADRSPRPNSDGKILRVSAGKVLNSSELESWLEWFFQIPHGSLTLWQNNRMYFYTADSQDGDSGAPVVDQRGEVYGIHAGGLTRTINGQLERISRLVVPDQFLPGE